MYIAMVRLKLVNLFVENQVILSATLLDIENEILCCKYIATFCQNNLVAASYAASYTAGR